MGKVEAPSFFLAGEIGPIFLSSKYRQKRKGEKTRVRDEREGAATIGTHIKNEVPAGTLVAIGR